MVKRESDAVQGKRISLYIHVPFCAAKCHYCSFYSVTGKADLHAGYLRALETEYRLLLDEEPIEIRATTIASIYIGGGTPSILAPEAIEQILRMLRSGPAWEPDCEVTIEVNPESVDQRWVAAYLAAGGNRISMGVQSFNDEELRMLGRLANSAQVAAAVRAIRAAGCENLNLDLMYGLPHQTLEGWLGTLEEAVACASEHVSGYLLTPEEETIFHHLLHGGAIEVPLEETLLEQYRSLSRVLSVAGYEHYEISNFARTGKRCRHNERTWRRAPYYGLGPAAHSFDGDSRWQNAGDIHAYVEHLLERQMRPLRERYRLGPGDEAKELILLGLRLAEGVPWARFEEVLSPEHFTVLRRRARFLRGTGFLDDDPESLRLAPSAYFVSNSVFVELIRAAEDG